MKVVKAGTEKRARLLESLHSPLDKELRKDTVNAQFGGKSSHLLRIGRILE